MSQNSMRIRQPVFVILPLNNKAHITRTYTDGIAPALRYFGFEPRRVDLQAVGGGISDAIHRQIADSYFVIADLSFERPNCYYELGYARALGKPVLLLKETTSKVHFDVSHLMVHPIKEAMNVNRLIKKLVPKFLESPERERDDNLNGRFGRRCIRNDYRLCAVIEHCTQKQCILTFEVTSLNDSRPLESDVKFHMHSSYKKSIQHIKAKDGIARYEEVTSDGPWTLGAEIIKTGTRLELDLATIPGARHWWYRDAYKLA